MDTVHAVPPAHGVASSNAQPVGHSDEGSCVSGCVCTSAPAESEHRLGAEADTAPRMLPLSAGRQKCRANVADATMYVWFDSSEARRGVDGTPGAASTASSVANRSTVAAAAAGGI